VNQKPPAASNTMSFGPDSASPSLVLSYSRSTLPVAMSMRSIRPVV
jgi:hypothetical protein